MRKFLLAAIFVGLTLFGATSFAQSVPESPAEKVEPKLTESEETEARALAKRFSTRMATTNSVGSLIDELGTRDLVANFKRSVTGSLPDPSEAESAETTEGEDQEYLAAKVFSALDDDTWIRFYRDFVDLYYLRRAGSSDEGPGDEDDERTDGTSREALAVMRSNRQVAVLFDESLDDEGFKSTGEFLQFLATLEAGEAIMRADLEAMRSAAASEKAAGDQDSTGKEWKILLCDLDPVKYGRPGGTRMIDVKLPTGIILTMIREDGELRIASIETDDD
jgi:hypothetical protein